MHSDVEGRLGSFALRGVLGMIRHRFIQQGKGKTALLDKPAVAPGFPARGASRLHWHSMPVVSILRPLVYAFCALFRSIVCANLHVAVHCAD